MVGFLLEADVCFAAVKSHTGNVGEHAQADASAGDDRLWRSGSLDGGEKTKHGGDFMLSTLLCAHGHRLVRLAIHLSSPYVLLLPLDYRGGTLNREVRRIINILTRSRWMTPRACATAMLLERRPSILLVGLVLGDHSSHARHTNSSFGFAASHYHTRALNENQVSFYSAYLPWMGNSTCPVRKLFSPSL